MVELRAGCRFARAPLLAAGLLGTAVGCAGSPPAPDLQRIDSRAAQSRDGLRTAGALDRLDLSVFGLHIGVDAYRQILVALGVGGYRDQALDLPAEPPPATARSCAGRR